MIKNLQTLLKQVETLIRKNDEILDATGSRFNIFRVLGVNHYETTHSAILAEFFNPKGSHAMGSKFLDLFLEEVNLKGFIEPDNAKVTTEMDCGNFGRIDIVIESKENAIIIENKIYASDQWEQLKRYEAFAKQHYSGNFKILYLTLFNSKPSDNSAEGVVYENITYNEHIIKWYEKCLMHTVNYPIVRETINQYINLLKKLTNKDMSKQLNQEVIDLLYNNVETSLMINDNIENMKQMIIINCAKKLAGDLPFKEEKCRGRHIYIHYKNYYILFGDDSSQNNPGNIYVSIRPENLVDNGVKNEKEPVKNDIFKNYSAKEYNPYGFSNLGFSFYENSTLIELTDENSPKFLILKEWVGKLKNYIDTLPVL